ncbi:MAG TPA: hypothetical protein PLR25_21150 [Planctomycetaceae bacterium]|nr:hypothetical protein [Planctomycetaceae bacterium]
MKTILSKIQRLQRFASPVAVVAFGCMVGCNDGDTGSTTTISEAPPAMDSHEGHDHAHPSEGPHHGDLVELGNEEFHAEVVHGEAGSVTVYILDSAAKVAVPIDATELTINVSHDGNAEQFKLAAERDASDPEAKSSRFTIKDEELASDLDSHDATSKLVVSINGKSYSGKIEHQHESEHSHDDGHKH